MTVCGAPESSSLRHQHAELTSVASVGEVRGLRGPNRRACQCKSRWWRAGHDAQCSRHLAPHLRVLPGARRCSSSLARMANRMSLLTVPWPFTKSATTSWWTKLSKEGLAVTHIVHNLRCPAVLRFAESQATRFRLQRDLNTTLMHCLIV